MGDIVELYTGRSRPAKTVRSKKITRVSEIPPMKLGEPDCAPIWEEIPKIKKVIDQSAKILDFMKEEKDS